jgi:hypothetical protein
MFLANMDEADMAEEFKSLQRHLPYSGSERNLQWKENLTYGLPEDEAVDVPGEHGRSGDD